MSIEKGAAAFGRHGPNLLGNLCHRCVSPLRSSTRWTATPRKSNQAEAIGRGI